MKLLKMFKYLLIIFLIINFSFLYSQNMILEGNFQADDFSWLCYMKSDIDEQIDKRFEYWESQYSNKAKYKKENSLFYIYRDCEFNYESENCKCCNFHSPDLEVDNFGNGEYAIYVGIGSYELIQQKLLSENKIIPKKFYKVSFRLKIPTTFFNGHNNITTESKLKFMLAKNKVKYKKKGYEFGKTPINKCEVPDNDGTEPDGYRQYKSNEIITIKDFNLIEFEKDIWHNVAFVFEIEDQGWLNPALFMRFFFVGIEATNLEAVY